MSADISSIQVIPNKVKPRDSFPVLLANAKYSFDLKSGQNFFIILKTQKEKDTFVAADS